MDHSPPSPETQATIDECVQPMMVKCCRSLPIVEDEKVIARLPLGDIVNRIVTTEDRTIRHLQGHYLSGNCPIQ